MHAFEFLCVFIECLLLLVLLKFVVLLLVLLKFVVWVVFDVAVNNYVVVEVQ